MVKKWTTTTLKRWKKRKFKRLIDQIVRMKLDYGAIVNWPLESGPVVFDNANSQFKDFSDLEATSYEMNTTNNVFTQFFGKKKIYAIKMVATPIKQLERETGVSSYLGYQVGKGHGTMNIDLARAMNNAFQLPSYGGDPITRFAYIKDLPWIDAADGFGGFFFVTANSNGIRGEMPQWEIRVSLYVKYKFNSL